MLFAVGCNPDDKGGDDLTTEAAISLNIESASVTLAGGEVKVDVTSNAKWTVKASANDVTFNPASGEKNGSTTIVVPASTTPRTIEVTFTATKQHLVAGVELPDFEYATLTISQNATGEVVEGGIASITEEGDYEIENAWVVATATQGFVMSDATGSAILVYTGSGASIPAIGTVVSVSGKVVTYNGKLQFDKTATVTPSSQTVTVNNGTPTEISTYAALDDLKNNIVVKYVEMKGKLECKMNSKGYMNYNIYVEDHNGYDDWKGSVYSPVAEIATKLESWNGAYVIARGYSIYVSGTVYVNIVATDVEIDASHPVLNAENIANVPAAGVQNATHNITVAALDNVTATPDGTIVTAASVSGNVLTYTVAANDGAAREGEIVLSAEGVESVTIKVAQNAAPSGDAGEEVTATITFNALGLADKEVVDGKTFNVDDNISLVFSQGTAGTATAYYNSSNGIRMYQNGAVLDVTAANGKVITKIEFTFDYNMWYFGCNTGTLSAEAATRTWNGEASAIKFTSTGTDKNHRCYIKEMKVTYR